LTEGGERMPRKALTAEQRRNYKLLDFKIWVIGQMKRNHVTQGDLAEIFGVSQPRVSKMLKIPDKKKKREEKINPDPFSYGQVIALCELFGVDEEERKKLLML